ncbi:hypothetical protein TrVE_jg12491 [Triparma verrucosa]|nr:hypothetical protein TrVE_jg12491 [Triparma verrucosa]
MGKVKEALFSTLRSFGLYEPGSKSVKWLDVFCGSGSVGLESLSRSHKSCDGGLSVFVDFAEDCCQTVRDNLDTMNFENLGYPIKSDALKALINPVEAGIDVDRFDVVSITPPYEEVVYADLVDAVCNSPVVGEDTVVVIEYPVELGSLPHVVKGSQDGSSTLVGVRNRKYGRTVIAIYVADPTGRMEGAESRPEEFISLK